MSSETAPASSAAPRSVWWRAAPWLVTLAYGSAFALLAVRHVVPTYSSETDFISTYLPDSDRIAAGEMPRGGFQGPGYATVLWAARRIVPDAFVAGKAISVVSATASVGLTYLLFASLFDFWTGLGASVLAGAAGVMPRFAAVASTDALFLAVALAACAVFVRGPARPLRLAATGALSGVAYLIRTNGVALAAAFAVLVLFAVPRSVPAGRRIAGVAILAAGWLLAASPWLFANARRNGSPFYSRNYLNVAAEFYGDRLGVDKTGDGMRALDPRYHSFRDVLAEDPKAIVRGWTRNLAVFSLRILRGGGVVSGGVAIAAAAGAICTVARRRWFAAAFLAVMSGAMLLLLALTHWETRYYLFFGAVCSGLAAFAVVSLHDALRDRRIVVAPAARSALAAAAFAAVCLTALAGARAEARSLLSEEPRELLAACGALRADGAAGSAILSRKPHLAFVCGQRAVLFPAVGSVDELRAWLKGRKVDYLVVSDVELQRRSAIATLRDPAAAPAWLTSVYVQERPVYRLYRIHNELL